MTERKRKILIADADSGVLRAMALALQQAGYEVLLARDGSKALEASILKAPDVVVIQRDCPLIDARRFAAILRSNPRTEHTPLLVLTTEPGLFSPRLLDGEVQKPIDAKAAVAAVAAAVRKVSALKSLRGGAEPLTGELGSLPATDLIELLAAHKKTGTLTLEGAFGKGEITLSNGAPIAATLGVASGRKGLFRLLVQDAGRFVFAAGPVNQDLALSSDLPMTLREARAQAQEWKALATELPKPETWLEPTGTQVPDIDVLPVAREILDLLSDGATVGDLIARSSASDFEAAQAIVHLLESRIVRVREERPAPIKLKQTAVLPEQLIAVLRAHVHKQPPGSVSLHRPRVLLVADPPKRLLSLGKGLEQIAEFAAETRGSWRFGYGLLGLMTLAEDFSLELVVLPLRRDLLPLSVPLAEGAIGVICLLEAAPETGGLDDLKAATGQRLSLPWLQVPGEQADAADARAIRGMLAALCRALN